jgi:trimeric autotransporter adhesin
MAAGQGFKTFTTGEVLTAGDVNGYLMQGINVFATTTARNAAITAPAEGQFAFTKDTNSLWYYDGAAWVASGAAGDIEGVTAGVGISGGGTSGTVTVTNSMATAIDAKGDLVPGTGADTFARLAVGANGTVLTADSAEATGIKWATPGGGKVVQIVAATYETGTSNSTTTFADTGLTATITPTSASNKILVIWDQGGLQKTATNASSELELKLLRGATTIATGYAGLTATALNNNPGNVGATILDTPATTSATTYKSQFRNGVNAASVVCQYNAGTSSLVLMEVTP